MPLNAFGAASAGIVDQCRNIYAVLDGRLDRVGLNGFALC
jgi:hypothetical protein